MQSIIVCDFNLGTQLQTIYCCNPVEQSVIELGRVAFSDLVPTIVGACQTKQINQVHLYGAVEILEGVAHQIKTQSELEYSDTNIIVEIN